MENKSNKQNETEVIKNKVKILIENDPKDRSRKRDSVLKSINWKERKKEIDTYEISI